MVILWNKVIVLSKVSSNAIMTVHIKDHPITQVDYKKSSIP